MVFGLEAALFAHAQKSRGPCVKKVRRFNLSVTLQCAAHLRTSFRQSGKASYPGLPLLCLRALCKVLRKKTHGDIVHQER